MVKGLAVQADVEPYFPTAARRSACGKGAPWGSEAITAWVAGFFVERQGSFVSIQKVKSGEMWNQISAKGKK